MKLLIGFSLLILSANSFALKKIDDEFNPTCSEYNKRSQEFHTLASEFDEIKRTTGKEPSRELRSKLKDYIDYENKLKRHYTQMYDALLIFNPKVEKVGPEEFFKNKCRIVNGNPNSDLKISAILLAHFDDSKNEWIRYAQTKIHGLEQDLGECRESLNQNQVAPRVDNSSHLFEKSKEEMIPMLESMEDTSIEY
jgi:hypothetical protein